MLRECRHKPFLLLLLPGPVFGQSRQRFAPVIGQLRPVNWACVIPVVGVVGVVGVVVFWPIIAKYPTWVVVTVKVLLAALTVVDNSTHLDEALSQ